MHAGGQQGWRTPCAAGAIAAASLTLALTGCGGADPRSAPPRGPASAPVLFAQACGACHSLIGNESAHRVGGDLVGFRMRRAAVLSFTRVMPVTRPLTEAQLRAVSDYVYAAQRRARRRGRPGSF